MGFFGYLIIGGLLGMLAYAIQYARKPTAQETRDAEAALDREIAINLAKGR